MTLYCKVTETFIVIPWKATTILIAPVVFAEEFSTSWLITFKVLQKMRLMEISILLRGLWSNVDGQVIDAAVVPDVQLDTVTDHGYAMDVQSDLQVCMDSVGAAVVMVIVLWEVG
jgi:hypothetical protein